MELAFLNIGTQEMVLILIVALLLFGGKKLPELARGLGRGIREFKDASEGIKKEIADQINNFEKDLDVTNVEDTRSSTTHPPTNAANPEGTTEAAEPTAETAATEHKSFPEFSTPENTYQHDPGAHPVDETEYYKYGYNDHFATDEPTNESSEEELVEKQDEDVQDKPKNS